MVTLGRRAVGLRANGTVVTSRGLRLRLRLWCNGRAGIAVGVVEIQVEIEVACRLVKGLLLVVDLAAAAAQAAGARCAVIVIVAAGTAACAVVDRALFRFHQSLLRTGRPNEFESGKVGTFSTADKRGDRDHPHEASFNGSPLSGKGRKEKRGKIEKIKEKKKKGEKGKEQIKQNKFPRCQTTQYA